MIFVLMAAAMLLWPMGGAEKVFSQTAFDHGFGNHGSFNQGFRQDFGSQSSWGTGRMVLDYQFDRADRELNPDRWMEEAQRGIRIARAVWAELAPEIFLDAQTAVQFTEWTERELENRFARWLMERFFGAGIEVPAASIFRETGEADKYFIYVTGDDGAILYDPNTGNPRVIRPGDDGHDFAENLLSWREMTHSAAGREVQDYRIGIIEMYPELLMYISPERKEAFEQKLATAGNQAVLSLKFEFEAILAREERYFTAQRLGDVWSLRKRSEDRSAAAIGAMLIEEARHACADGIASIEARIEAARADGADLAIAGNQWLEEYREQFNRGLNAWESAEERFLLRRIEWERSAEQAFFDGTETWNAAFVRFEEERRKWEEEARLLFLEGEQFFIQASQDLSAAIAEARMEFERDFRLRTGVVSERIGALANMYFLSSAAVEEARNNIDFWIGRYRREVNIDAAIPSGNGELELWIDEELLNLDDAANGLERLILEELKIWSALHRSYTARVQENLKILARELSSVTGIWSHYETEILRAEAELEYWKNRTATAEAVAAYAQALDAGRMTAAESLEAWERAKADYDEAAILYESADDSLRKGGAELSAARGSLMEAAEKMRAADAALEQLRQNYHLIANSSRSMESGIIAENVALFQRQLSAEQARLGRLDETSPWGKFFNMARELEALQLQEMRKEVLRQIIAGDGERIASLSDLARRAESGGRPEDDPILAIAEALYAEEKISSAQYDLFLSILWDSSQSMMETELDLRLAAISLLLESNSAADWYFSVLNTGSAEMSDFAIPDMEAHLFSEWEKHALELLRARTELELKALDFIEGKESTEAAEILASLYTGDETAIQLDRARLEKILELINTGAPTDDEKILFFLIGGSFIDPYYGREIAEAFLKDYVRREEFSRGLYDFYTGFNDLAPVLVRENLAREFGSIDRLWKTIGIETEDFILPPTEAIINALTALDGNVYAGISPLFFILDEIFFTFPPWLDVTFNLWKENLIEYVLSSSEAALALAERHAGHLDAALRLLLNDAQTSAAADFETEAARYLVDPLLEFAESKFDPTDTLDYNDLDNAVEELLDHYSRERYIMGEIDRLSSLLDILDQCSEAVEREVKNISDEIVLAEENYAELAAAYQDKAVNFQHIGAAYDTLYDKTEQAFRNLENARKDFETQDAIRLWAESAYLDAGKPAEDLEYCRERANRALDVLELLNALLADKKISETGEYENAYARYQESLALFTLSLDAMYKLERSIGEEQVKTNSAYHAYQDRLALFGESFSIKEGYASPEEKSEWGIKDIITVDENGFLVFALNNDKMLLGSDEERSEMLRNYFDPDKITDGEIYRVSSFELALRELNTILFAGDLTNARYTQLGLARDYLMREIIRNNPEIAGLKWYRRAENLDRDYNLGNMIIDPSGNVRVYEVAANNAASLHAAQMNSWNALDENAKKALEFYTILTLLGAGGVDSEYFSRISEHQEYYMAHLFANNRFAHYRKRARYIVVGIFYKNNMEITRATNNELASASSNVNRVIRMAYHGLTETLSALDETFNVYKDSSEKLLLLRGEKNEIVNWEDIENVLASMSDFSGDISALRKLWEQVSAGTASRIYDVHRALQLMAEASRNLVGENSRHLYNVWQTGEEERYAYEISYRELYAAYLAGHADLGDLQAAAVLSFGGAVPDRRTHLENTADALMENLYKFTELGLSGTAEAPLLAGEYISIINRAWEEKYSSELNIRMNEWDVQRRDIQEKLTRWQESAGIILEQGRIAWKEGEEQLRQAGNLWAKSFEEEYERISDGWTASYLEGLKDKEAWAAAALEAAGHASSDAAIALVGSGAEAGARAMDTRDPLGFMNLPDIQEGERIISGLLERSGTGALSAAFGSIRVSAGTLAAVVRTGISGGGIWSSASALTEAAALARTVREEFEARESRKMAFMVMSTSNDLYLSLEENVRLANEQFRKEMDEMFIMGGRWRRSSMGYIKDVIVHSTLFNSVITERAEVEGYRNFIFIQTRSSAYMDEESLLNLNNFQIEALIDLMHSEINELFRRIFDPVTGEFPAHTGLKSKSDIEDEPTEPSGDLDTGESGRLLAEFYYWMHREHQGITSVGAAPWDKPMWDSRDSAINAPTLRTTANVALSVGVIIAGAVTAVPTGGSSVVGSIALTAALNSADDLVFTALDIAGGYKSWGEAGMEFGKTLLSNIASAATGAVFNGLFGVSSEFFSSGGISGLVTDHGIGGVVFNTYATGINTFATGTINSIVASVTYDDTNGFGFSDNSFMQGLKGNAIGVLSGMAGTFTGGAMNLGLDGFVNTGSLNGKNIYADGQKLSGLVGGLASQSVNYAFGNDFTLNIFNVGMLLGKKHDASAGLVEMQFGRNGINFALGSGGADVSIGTLASAARGLEAWKVNTELLFSKNSDSRTYASQMRTIYSMGGDGLDLYESILAGKTIIKERRGVAETKTRLGSDGIKTIYLGSDALDDGSRFGLNVVFSHEAYRDGLHSGEIGQKIETYNAVIGHIATINALRGTYGDSAVGEQMLQRANEFNNAWENNDFAALFTILESFDSSADYWKLIKDNDRWGTIEDYSADFDVSDLYNSSNYHNLSGPEKELFFQAIFGSWQQDGKDLGVISADRMTLELVEALGFIAVTRVPEAGREHNGLYFPTPLERATDMERYALIHDILGRVAYNAAHTKTFNDKGGRPVTVHNLDEANSRAQEILRQDSASLSEIDYMRNYGCNFMAIISIPQLLTKQVFDAQQITDIWNTAVRREIMKKNGFVNDREALTNLALQKLGITNFGIHLDGTSRNNATSVGYRVRVPYRSTGHFVLTGTNRTLIYNPGNTFTTDQNKWDMVEIFVYGR